MPHAILDPDVGLSLICQLLELVQTVGSVHLIKLYAFSSLDCWPQFTLSINDAAVLNMSIYFIVPGQTSSVP